MNKYTQHLEELGQCVYSPEDESTVLAEEELRTIENTLGYSLPTDYREFLTDFGGYSIYANFPIDRSVGEPNASLGKIYGYGCKIPSSLNLVTVHQRDLANMVTAPELLGIACDLGGNQTCLFLAGERKGKIYWWHSEEADVPYEYQNLYFVANSFDEFMQLLKSDE